MKTKHKQSWVIRVIHEVEKEIVTSDCTEDEAREHPWAFAVQEREIDSRDWEIRSIEPND